MLTNVTYPSGPYERKFMQVQVLLSALIMRVRASLLGGARIFLPKSEISPCQNRLYKQEGPQPPERRSTHE